MNNQVAKNMALWLVILLIIFMVYSLLNHQREVKTQVGFSDFLTQVEKGEITEVTIQGRNITGILDATKKPFETYAPDDPTLVPTLREKNVQITAKPEDESPWYMTLLISWFPIILIVGVWIFFMRQMQAGGGKAMSFGKARVKLLSEGQTKVTFDDVAGIDEAKDELEEIIAFLKDPKKFTRLGGRIPKGVLLVGSPGTGKTLLAKAIAGEAGVPFFSISGSDFVEMFVGVGASRVRDLFVQGKKHAPCLIFIDEIDAMGRHRGAGLGGGHDEREQTLNQLLVEMDGFEGNEGVILIAATNRPDVLDPALLRPGRFDRHVVVPKPDIKGREKILKVHTKGTPLSPDVDLQVVARGTPGFSGADLANLVNEAALMAARRNKAALDRVDFERARDKVLMGSERKSMVISEKEKRVTAYHEAGHTIVAMKVGHVDPVHKVTIIPRGMALGLTQTLPTDDRHSLSEKQILATLAMLFGGRAAEELIFNETTTGAGNDIERATELARKMVCEWGMSDKLGPLAFGKKEEAIFLGRDIAQHKDYSEDTAVAIDQEIRRIVQENHDRAMTILRENLDLLHRMSQALLERETLDAAEIELLAQGRPLPPMQAPEPPPPPARTPSEEKEEKPAKAPVLGALEPQGGGASA